MKTYGIKKLMNEKNIFIKQLSRIARINDSHLGKIINGKTKNPGIDYLITIAITLIDHKTSTKRANYEETMFSNYNYICSTVSISNIC